MESLQCAEDNAGGPERKARPASKSEEFSSILFFRSLLSPLSWPLSFL